MKHASGLARVVAPDRPVVNVAVTDALRDAAAAYEARGVLVVDHLDATAALATEDAVLYQSVYTLFRGLPARLTPGAALYVSTADRTGGDIELVWESREDVPPSLDAGTARTVLAAGPYGDLFDLALHGLETLCRARAVHEETESGEPGRLRLRRRFMFLLPSLRREGTNVPTASAP